MIPTISTHISLARTSLMVYSKGAEKCPWLGSHFSEIIHYTRDNSFGGQIDISDMEVLRTGHLQFRSYRGCSSCCRDSVSSDWSWGGQKGIRGVVGQDGRGPTGWKDGCWNLQESGLEQCWRHSHWAGSKTKYEARLMEGCLYLRKGLPVSTSLHNFWSVFHVFKEVTLTLHQVLLWSSHSFPIIVLQAGF